MKPIHKIFFGCLMVGFGIFILSGYASVPTEALYGAAICAGLAAAAGEIIKPHEHARP